MTEKRFVCYFDDILKKWCVQDTDSLDMHYVADELMGEEFAHLLNLYHQTLDSVEKENDQLKKILGFLRNDNATDILNVLNSQENQICELKKENGELEEENERLENKLWNCQNMR